MQRSGASSTSRLILYELNEVPWRVIDWYRQYRPKAALCALADRSSCYTSLTKDDGELHPWSTWPTVHRGVYNSTHGIRFLNQDKSSAAAWPPLWEIASRAGKRVGLFGSLQSYPMPEGLRFSFYIPDTFAPQPAAHPERYTCFQRLNLRQTARDGAVAQDVKLTGSALVDAAQLVLNGMTISTMTMIAHHLVRERLEPLYRTRRPILQAPLAFDVFAHALRNHEVDLATFFTNHVAGVMHRYWKYAFPEDFGYALTKRADFFHRNSLLTALDIADRQVAFLRRYADDTGATLVVASSMGQEAIRRRYYGELRIVNVGAFMHGIGFNGAFRSHLAMQPDFVFEFDTSDDVTRFLACIALVVTRDAAPIFCRVRAEGLTVNVALDPDEDAVERERVFVKNGDVTEELPLSRLGMKRIYRDVGTGYHQPEGILIWYESGGERDGRRTVIETIEIAPRILRTLGIEPSAHINRGPNSRPEAPNPSSLDTVVERRV